ncbi:MAG: hypothetical protein ACM3JE_00350 [Betaproteobacteria bacterium]
MLPQDSNLTVLTTRAIALYNRTHSPTTKATLVLIAPPFLTIKFTGVICTGCGTQDITDGFASQYGLLSGGKIELKTGKTTQVDPHTIQTTYNIKNK